MQEGIGALPVPMLQNDPQQMQMAQFEAMANYRKGDPMQGMVQPSAPIQPAMPGAPGYAPPGQMQAGAQSPFGPPLSNAPSAPIQPAMPGAPGYAPPGQQQPFNPQMQASQLQGMSNYKPGNPMQSAAPSPFGQQNTGKPPAKMF
jgi:hypothetical protein